MRRTPVSAGFEGDLRLVCSFHEIGPVDTVSFEAQNKVRINLGDIFTELLNSILVRVGASENNVVSISILSPTNDLDRVSGRVGRTSLADR